MKQKNAAFLWFKIASKTVDDHLLDLEITAINYKIQNTSWADENDKVLQKPHSVKR